MIENGWFTAFDWIFAPNKSDRFKAFHFASQRYHPLQESKFRAIGELWRGRSATGCDLKAAPFRYGVTVLNQKPG